MNGITKNSLLRTVAVKPIFPHLICTMNDGSQYDFDMTEILKKNGQLIIPLRNPDIFNKASISKDGELIWPTGYDLAPDRPVRSGTKVG